MNYGTHALKHREKRNPEGSLKKRKSSHKKEGNSLCSFVVLVFSPKREEMFWEGTVQSAGGKDLKLQKIPRSCRQPGPPQRGSVSKMHII